MKIIDMSKVVDSDTLCEFRYDYEYFKFDDFYLNLIKDSSIKIQIAENIWQSTANSLVIPEGLICDVEYLGLDGAMKQISNIDSGLHLKQMMVTHIVTAIKVTGKQEGYAYAWEVE